tara:strand:- start:9701 stop:10207 length:507 start_codon:yes stop_codon:yes gene_type:complete
MYKHFIIILFLLLLVQESFSEDNFYEIGNYGDWDAFYWDMKEGKVCAIVSLPLKEEGNYTKRGKVYSQVSKNAGQTGEGVVSFQAGYTFKNKSDIKVNIDKKNSLILQSVGRVAWTSTPEEDVELIKYMKLGNKMIVEGVSSRGTNTKDTYSLSGFSAAYKAISKVCN